MNYKIPFKILDSANIILSAIYSVFSSIQNKYGSTFQKKTIMIVTISGHFSNCVYFYLGLKEYIDKRISIKFNNINRIAYMYFFENISSLRK